MSSIVVAEKELESDEDVEQRLDWQSGKSLCSLLFSSHSVRDDYELKVMRVSSSNLYTFSPFSLLVHLH